MEAFIHEAGVNILTTLLFLKKKSKEEKIAESMAGPQDYPVFMAIAEKVGIDRRGNPVYQRYPDGEIVVEVQVERERIRIGGAIKNECCTGRSRSSTMTCLRSAGHITGSATSTPNRGWRSGHRAHPAGGVRLPVFPGVLP